MQHFTFGRNNGLRVSELALGTGNFGTRWGYGTEPEEARQIVETFAEAGGTFLDTAASYQAGESEEILGKLLAGRRDAFTVATKFSIGGPDGSGRIQTGNGRRAMFRSVEGSLQRLGTDYIDLLWVHFPDRVTPVDEIMRAFDDLAASGKVLYAGLSNFPAWLTSRAATLAELRGLIPLAGVQFEYSLVERGADREIFPMAEALGVGAALWSPLGGGLLTGKYGYRRRRSKSGRRHRDLACRGSGRVAARTGAPVGDRRGSHHRPAHHRATRFVSGRPLRRSRRRCLWPSCMIRCPPRTSTRLKWCGARRLSSSIAQSPRPSRSSATGGRC
jgi:aryl-alcohol dehydrogenase-like predicted oxidoreductase